jgi:hypothetical protein
LTAPVWTGPAEGLDVQPHDELERRYQAYRSRQAARFLHLLPRDAIRPLYRRALVAMGGDTDAARDPLAVLTDFCEGLLPLPPFDVWLDDLRRHPEGHLRDLEESVDAPTADAPATLEVRRMEAQGRSWQVRLRSFRDDAAWRGFMSFQEDEGGPAYHTAAVFREADPVELVERFRSFEPSALEAFLRSSLP